MDTIYQLKNFISEGYIGFRLCDSNDDNSIICISAKHIWFKEEKGDPGLIKTTKIRFNFRCKTFFNLAVEICKLKLRVQGSSDLLFHTTYEGILRTIDKLYKIRQICLERNIKPIFEEVESDTTVRCTIRIDNIIAYVKDSEFGKEIYDNLLI